MNVCYVCEREINRERRSALFTSYGTVTDEYMMLICEECYGGMSNEMKTEIERKFSRNVRKLADREGFWYA